MGKTIAATLAVGAALMVAGPSLAQDWSAEVYGGFTGKRDADYSGVDYPMDQGTALGFGVYNSALVPGLSVGVDVMGTRALYIGFPGQYINSLSIMAVARKEFELSPSLVGYGSAGLGIVRNTYDSGTINYSDETAAGQVSLGLRYGLSDSGSVFGEVKHQVGFKDATFTELGGDTQEYSSTSLLIGYSFGF